MDDGNNCASQVHPPIFSLPLKAAGSMWLKSCGVHKEEIIKPIIIGQSMGGYVGQAYAQLYPDRLAGFISINSAPLQRNYVTAVEIWLLKRMEPIYAHYPWKLLLKSGTEEVATSGYGRNLMKETCPGFL